MSFLTPLFLLGLAALAMPVLIHLIQRERKRVVQFPSLMFLQRDPVPIGAAPPDPQLAAAAAAAGGARADRRGFRAAVPARPELAAAAGGAREVVVLLDRSYSMGYGDQWTRAQQAAARCDRRRSAPSIALSLVFFATARRWPAIDARRRARLRRDQRRDARRRAPPGTARR